MLNTANKIAQLVTLILTSTLLIVILVGIALTISAGLEAADAIRDMGTPVELPTTPTEVPPAEYYSEFPGDTELPGEPGYGYDEEMNLLPGCYEVADGNEVLEVICE